MVREIPAIAFVRFMSNLFLHSAAIGGKIVRRHCRPEEGRTKGRHGPGRATNPVLNPIRGSDLQDQEGQPGLGLAITMTVLVFVLAAAFGALAHLIALMLANTLVSILLLAGALAAFLLYLRRVRRRYRKISSRRPVTELQAEFEATRLVATMRTEPAPDLMAGTGSVTGDRPLSGSAPTPEPGLEPPPAERP